MGKEFKFCPPVIPLFKACHAAAVFAVLSSLLRSSRSVTAGDAHGCQYLLKFCSWPFVKKNKISEYLK